MGIKTVGQLKKIIADIDDDFELAISLRELIPEEELSKMVYKFPYDDTDCEIEFDDVGHSSHKICFSVYKK